jgi:general secretion pathway protein J
MSRGNTDTGFTLVELLVATSLLALLSVVLFGGMRFGARAWEAGEASIERTGEVEAAQDLLRRTFSEIAVSDLTGSEETQVLAGKSDLVSFIAPLPQHLDLGGLGRYRLNADDAGHLLLAWDPQRPEQKLEDPPATKPAVILANIAALKIEYYGREHSNEKPIWRDEWTSKDLPMLIRIEVGFTAGDGRHWPELTIAPRLASHATAG